MIRLHRVPRSVQGQLLPTAVPAGPQRILRLAGALLALGGLLGACQGTTELRVTTVTYLGVPLDLVRQEEEPRTSYGDSTLFLVVRCGANGRVVLRQSFFPGPEWAVLKTPGRITATRDGLTIRGADPGQTVVIRPAHVTPCTH